MTSHGMDGGETIAFTLDVVISDLRDALATLDIAISDLEGATNDIARIRQLLSGLREQILETGAKC